jgi:sulfide:quinone oxidoreductase
MPLDRRSSLRVLIAGGGVAGLEAALALRALAAKHVSVELVAPEEDFTYRPLAVAEPFRIAKIRRFPLARLVEETGATLLRGSVSEVDAARRVARTREGDELGYDVLVLALGARPVEAVPNALTFGGADDGPALAAMLEDTLNGELRRLSFALPAGVGWPLPLYELALLTGTYLTDTGTRGVKVSVVTPEEAPLALFGAAPSDAVRELLEIRGIALHVSTTPLRFEAGMLHVAPDSRLEADRVIALPRLEGRAPLGIPHDRAGFVPTDSHCRVMRIDGVYAVGDLTEFPIKQGGIAAQQADAAAEAIAADAGAPIEPTPFRPVLRGLLLTGIFPRYLRSEVGKGVSTVDEEPLWWPPAKIVGRHLAPFLAERLRLSEAPPPAAREGVVTVEVELDPHHAGALAPL